MGLSIAKTSSDLLFFSGILVCLAATALMFNGTILGETTNVATIIGIIGIGLIASKRKVMNNGGD